MVIQWQWQKMDEQQSNIQAIDVPIQQAVDVAWLTLTRWGCLGHYEIPPLPREKERGWRLWQSPRMHDEEIVGQLETRRWHKILQILSLQYLTGNWCLHWRRLRWCAAGAWDDVEWEIRDEKVGTLSDHPSAGKMSPKRSEGMELTRVNCYGLEYFQFMALCVLCDWWEALVF